jgi:hypothetical protein
MKRPIPRTPQNADASNRKRSPEPDRPLTQEEIDRIMSEVYRIILAAGAARKAEEESEA